MTYHVRGWNGSCDSYLWIIAFAIIIKGRKDMKFNPLVNRNSFPVVAEWIQVEFRLDCWSRWSRWHWSGTKTGRQLTYGFFKHWHMLYVEFLGLKLGRVTIVIQSSDLQYIWLTKKAMLRKTEQSKVAKKVFLCFFHASVRNHPTLNHMVKPSVKANSRQ